jgi:hypothetical protein
VITKEYRRVGHVSFEFDEQKPTTWGFVDFYSVWYKIYINKKLDFS